MGLFKEFYMKNEINGIFGVMSFAIWVFFFSAVLASWDFLGV